MPKNENLLSICYIAKDSILKLPESFRIMKKLSDDIVVIDTGSIDGTFEWAESRPEISAYKFNWSHSFSKARNFGIKKCLGRIILMMDDDEYIPENFHSDVLAVISKLKAKAVFSFPVVNFLQNPKWVANAKKLDGIAQRMFANDGEIKYKNRVHEKLVNLKTYLKVPLQIPIFHMQYKSLDNISEKMESYRKLIFMDIKENGEITFLDEIHLANTYREIFRWSGNCADKMNAIKHLTNALTIKDINFVHDEIEFLKGADCEEKKFN